MSGTRDHSAKKPFIEHVRELQVRLTWSVLAVVLGSIGGYLIHEKLLNLIQKPLGETLYYTSPTGGFSFVFKLCVVFGIVVATPMIAYQVFKFSKPLLGRGHRGVILNYLLWSVNLAYAGVLFAYFISLPSALHFLTNFGGQQIESLITADEYFNFALAYIGGFAVLFQLPLIVLFINRIKPMRPSKMMKNQRYIILGSFIVAAILTPTPDPFNQAVMALPVILLYQISVIMVWLINRKYFKKSAQLVTVRAEKVVKPRRAIPVPMVSMIEVVPVMETQPLTIPRRRLIDMVVT